MTLPDTFVGPWTPCPIDFRKYLARATDFQVLRGHEVSIGQPMETNEKPMKINENYQKSMKIMKNHQRGFYFVLETFCERFHSNLFGILYSQVKLVSEMGFMPKFYIVYSGENIT